MPSSPQIRIGVVILAAGRSRRMGQPKLLLPWGNTSILGHLLRAWDELGAAEISVVIRFDDLGISGELDRLNFPQAMRILNSEPEADMFSSVQCAARWAGARTSAEAVTHYAVALGDQPHVRRTVLAEFLAFASQRAQAVCQPAHAGRPRHPVILPRPIFEQLADTRTATLKQFLAGCEVSLFECAEPGLDLDLDTPADYQRALSLAKEPHE